MQSGHFFPKLGHFFKISKNGQGRPPPLPRLVMHLLEVPDNNYFLPTDS